jgi:hypothetical protein
LTYVDVGDVWLIFGLPPEIAVNPSDKNSIHEFFLMCDDTKAFIAEMKKHGIVCDRIEDEKWELLTYLTLPSGGKLGIYQPRHARPNAIN